MHFSRHDLRFIALKCSRDGINEQSVSTYSFISNVSARSIYQNKFGPRSVFQNYHTDQNNIKHLFLLNGGNEPRYFIYALCTSNAALHTVL